MAALCNNYQIKFAISGSHLDITTKLKYRAITTFLHLPNPEIIKMFLYTPCLIMCADTPLVIYLLNKTPLAVCKATLSITQPGSSISIHSYQCLQTQRLCIYLLDSSGIINMGEYTFRHTSDLFSCLSWTGSRQNGTSVCQVSTTHPDTNRIIILESELLLPQSLTQFLLCITSKFRFLFVCYSFDHLILQGNSIIYKLITF